MTWIAKREIRVERPEGYTSIIREGYPIPPEIVDKVPAKDRRKAQE